MFNTPAKMARENIARAGRDLLKGDMARAVSFCCEALKIMIESTIFGKEKFEVEVHLQEFLKEFNQNAEVKAYYAARGVHTTPYVRFARGEERKLLSALTALLGDLQQVRDPDRRGRESSARPTRSGNPGPGPAAPGSQGLPRP
jgi:hypothetical protein